VSFLVEVPRHRWLHDHRGGRRCSAEGEACLPDEDLWTGTGKLWGARLLTGQTTRPAESDGAPALDTYKVLRQAEVLTNICGIHALTAPLREKAWALVEQRIKELVHLLAGKTEPSETHRSQTGNRKCASSRS